jgi:hypothetical protein
MSTPSKPVIINDDTPDDTLISKKTLCELSGNRSHMWPGRQAARDPNFPQVCYVNGRPYYRLGDWRAWRANLPTAPPPELKEAGERVEKAAREAQRKDREEREADKPAPAIVGKSPGLKPRAPPIRVVEPVE